MASKVLDKILNTPMNRREFLARMGALVLAVIGVTAILRALGLQENRSADDGYGKTGYGK